MCSELENLLDTHLSDVFVHNRHLHIRYVDIEGDKDNTDMGKSNVLMIFNGGFGLLSFISRSIFSLKHENFTIER